MEINVLKIVVFAYLYLFIYILIYFRINIYFQYICNR